MTNVPGWRFAAGVSCAPSPCEGGGAHHRRGGGRRQAGRISRARAPRYGPGSG